MYFFDEDMQLQDQTEHTPELEVSFMFDYENLLNDGKEKEVKLCASIRPSEELRRNFKANGEKQGTHICLLIDISDSMSVIVDKTNIVRTGRKEIGEDGREYEIVSGGINKLKIAVESAKKVAELLREGDTLSCIRYSSEPELVFHDLKASDKELIKSKLDQLLGHYGQDTNITKALAGAGSLLYRYEDTLAKRILFFTDGEPTGGDTEEKGIEMGKRLAQYDITVESMGFGKNDVNYSYLQKIAASSGGTTNLIKYPDEFAAVFAAVFEQSQSVVITNVKLVLKLTQGTRIYDYYRGTPENVYLGNREGSEERVFEIKLGQIEKNQMYKYFFNMKLPGMDAEYEGPVNTMQAELHYSVPGTGKDQEQIIKVNVPVNYTSDLDETQEINGDIHTLFRLAEVKRLDEEREKAFAAGNKEATVKLIKTIIRTYTELQKKVEAEAYMEMLDEYMRTNHIPKAILNKATSSSSQAQETGIMEDLGEEDMNRLGERLKKRKKRRIAGE